MIICPEELCTGCYACYASCPVGAIDFELKKYGVYGPTVDMRKCTGCLSCVKSCPNNSVINFFTPKYCYAAWLTDAKKRSLCASGGIATALSEYVINDKKGVVYGTRYGDNLQPIISVSSTIEELDFFKGSKYIHSVAHGVYCDIKAKLYSGMPVLFIGTPCQVAGLISFLKKRPENLYTCDLLCHGVSPYSFFADEITYLKEKKHFKNITNCTFRNNNGTNYQFVLYDGDKIIYRKSAYSSYYFSAFLKGISLSESCYNCRYARSDRIADITVGDFIGLGIDYPFEHSPNNVSVVLINTDKGEGIWLNCISCSGGIVSFPRLLAEAVKYGASLRAPFPRHFKNKAFLELLTQKGFARAIRTVLWLDILVNNIKIIMYKIVHFYKIPSKLLKVLRRRYKEND